MTASRAHSISAKVTISVRSITYISRVNCPISRPISTCGSRLPQTATVRNSPRKSKLDIIMRKKWVLMFSMCAMMIWTPKSPLCASEDGLRDTCELRADFPIFTTTGWLQVQTEYRGHGYASQLVLYFSHDCFSHGGIPHYGYAVSESSTRVAGQVRVCPHETQPQMQKTRMDRNTINTNLPCSSLTARTTSVSRRKGYRILQPDIP